MGKKVLQFCRVDDRAPHMGDIIELLRDECLVVRNAVPQTIWINGAADNVD